MNAGTVSLEFTSKSSLLTASLISKENNALSKQLLLTASPSSQAPHSRQLEGHQKYALQRICFLPHVSYMPVKTRLLSLTRSRKALAVIKDELV
ncbi:hypothetical protein NDU88_011595 [Pleurodeles waltl]|uniref:Uncharacterized protein n=1 Tax=Pleurodeles waltl TaxID=8319 RepID=A0AAV7S6P6_PLEWA|nr:hypothetical protein NDU88_011595 [Pleurodeles waltl]